MQEKLNKNAEISERISQVIDYYKINKNEFAKKLNYDRSQTIYDIINGKSAPSFDFFNRLLNSEFSDINTDWLITGKGKMILENSNILNEPVAFYGKKEVSVPMFDVLVIAGTSNTSIESEAKEYIHPGDLFLDCDSIMRVYGDSMEPKYPSGCFVPVKKSSINSLIYGQDYIIVTEHYRILKRIQKNSNDSILACSINQECWEMGELKGKLIHEPIELKLSEIKNIYLVIGVITRNQISNIYGK